ncbi:ferredoxin reductase domain-containing protein [Mucilaginibacter ginsenosidivorans]|uniref:Flavodoxin reductase n=1 Tax=Mucilaginibacter ginsenosidivorans TaxID=398053 RepID=A0A5B8UYJ0_9SPHI|nr:flavodoxin reductase [Mucilaginibacter ginsenosidivorans]QEC64079.1 flavodoxin reductase [Mucilaginibacter ginsenosidivorans]
MEKHIVKVLATRSITHNVKQFDIEKPKGYKFFPGQATDVSLNKKGLKDDLHPFTFTSLNEWDNLQFTVKIYTDHDGMTNKLQHINGGDELIIHDVWGAINFRGPGLFIAGGAGVTPFIAILRQLYRDGHVNNCKLLFANKSVNDIILNDEFRMMLGENFINILDKTDNPKFLQGHIDKQLIQKYATDDMKYFYVCGPDKFTEDMVKCLEELGKSKECIIIEE